MGERGGGGGGTIWLGISRGWGEVKVNPVSVIDEKLSQFLLNEQSL